MKPEDKEKYLKEKEEKRKQQEQDEYDEIHGDIIGG